MEKIGEKINRLRKEMGLSQDNIHHQQSLVSQIESGSISKPGEGVLHEIAQNLDTTFLSLVDDTDWKAEPTIKSKEIAFSPVMVDVEIDDDGNISWSHKSYSLYNEKGEKAEYCLETGLKLIDSCENCSRQVENVKQEYCIGCGKALFSQFTLPSNFLIEAADNRIPRSWYDCVFAINDISNSLATSVEIIGYIKMLPNVTDTDQKKMFIERIKRYANEPMKLEIEIALNKKKPIPDHVSNHFKFWIQVEKEQLKKLKSVISGLKEPSEEDTARKALSDSIALKLEDSLSKADFIDPTILMDMLLELRTTRDPLAILDKAKVDTSELMEKVRSVAQEMKTDDESDDKKNSEDGNSETDAAENAERNNKNAKIENKEKED
jgi:transcriptional regulator with XRE-family HTH domain